MPNLSPSQPARETNMAWQSKPITIDGIEVQVHADEDGVTFGKIVDEVYASDLVLTTAQARQIGNDLIDAADHAEGLA